MKNPDICPDGQLCPGSADPAPAFRMPGQLLPYIRKYHLGRENPVSRGELELIFGMSDRTVRRRISALRKNGCPICSTGAGYFYAETEAEVLDTVDRLDRMLFGIAAVRMGLLEGILPDSGDDGGEETG